MLDFYVLRLRRTKSDGSLINGRWRNQQWVEGETIFPTHQSAKVVRGRVGGDILPFKESRLYQMVTQEVRDAIEKVEDLSMNSLNEDIDDADLSPLFHVSATKDD